MGWFGDRPYINNSPSSLGSRRRENERRKKTRIHNCHHDTAFRVEVLDGSPSTCLRFPSETRRFPDEYPTICLWEPYHGAAGPRRGSRTRISCSPMAQRSPRQLISLGQPRPWTAHHAAGTMPLRGACPALLPQRGRVYWGTGKTRTGTARGGRGSPCIPRLHRATGHLTSS